MSIDFKCSSYLKEVIRYAVFFYVGYAVSYRDLKETITEGGFHVDHVSLNRSDVKYLPEITNKAKQKSCRPSGIGRWMKLTLK